MSNGTPHNSAKKEDISNIVIMAGDPLRSKFIAENFLTNIKLVNNVRGIQCYTGEYKGKRITVSAHGMGNPSMGIYSHEFFNFYDVDKIIRVGSMGALTPDVKINDIVISRQCLTKTNYDSFYIKNGQSFVGASENLVKKVEKKAKELGYEYHIGDTLCSDDFYTDEDQVGFAKENNLLGVEMESAALYIEAKKANKEAVVICTISDSLVTKEVVPPEIRQTGFTKMMQLALEVAIN